MVAAAFGMKATLTLFSVFLFICQLTAQSAAIVQKNEYHEDFKVTRSPIGSCTDSTSGTTCEGTIGDGGRAIIDNLRGGSLSGVDDKTVSAIRQFLASPMEVISDEFYIQGWRWHVMSLIRDSGRLERLANKLSKNSDADSSGLAALEQAANYVVKFNMAGLYRIESKLFVKWLRDHLCDATVVGPFSEGNAVGISKAFGETIGKIDEYRLQSEKMGNELYDLAKSASDASAAPHQRQTLLRDIARLSTQLSERLHLLRNLQETLIVPSVARVVPPGEQKSFNNKVLMQLGLLESRVHLVGMHDAVWDSGMESEKKKFESEIPYVARMMIERWRKSLYIPKAGALDYEC